MEPEICILNKSPCTEGKGAGSEHTDLGPDSCGDVAGAGKGRGRALVGAEGRGPGLGVGDGSEFVESFV